MPARFVFRYAGNRFRVCLSGVSGNQPTHVQDLGPFHEAYGIGPERHDGDRPFFSCGELDLEGGADPIGVDRQRCAARRLIHVEAARSMRSRRTAGAKDLRDAVFTRRRGS